MGHAEQAQWLKKWWEILSHQNQNLVNSNTHHMYIEVRILTYLLDKNQPGKCKMNQWIKILCLGNTAVLCPALHSSKLESEWKKWMG